MRVKAFGNFSLMTVQDGVVTKEIKNSKNVITDYWHKQIHTNDYSGGLGNTANGFAILTAAYVNDSTAHRVPKYCHVGTSTNERTFVDTSLGNSIASVEMLPIQEVELEEVVIESVTYIKSVTRYRFPIGDVTGTITEVGVYLDSSPTSMAAGQLIKDGGGVPTSISVLSTESLIVDYTLYYQKFETEEVYSGLYDDGSTTYPFTITTTPIIGYNTTGQYAYGNLVIDGEYTSNILIDGVSVPTASYSVVTTEYDNRIEKNVVLTIETGIEYTINDIDFATYRGRVNSTSSLLNTFFKMSFDTPVVKLDTETLTVSFNFVTKWREV